MAVAQVLLGTISYVLIVTGTLGKADYTLALVLQEIALLLIPLSMAVGYFLFRYMLSRLDRQLPLEEKVKKYFSFTLIRGALFEIGFLFCCAAALITKVELFLWIAPIVFLVFLLVRPTPEGMTTDMQLSQADSSKLRGS
jgi:hypothetical protein